MIDFIKNLFKDHPVCATILSSLVIGGATWATCYTVHENGTVTFSNGTNSVSFNGVKAMPAPQQGSLPVIEPENKESEGDG